MLVLVTLSLRAQEPPIPSTPPATVNTTAPQHDKSAEHRVASLFDSIRAAQYLPQLARIHDEGRIEQLTCTRASRNVTSTLDGPMLQAFYTTQHLEVVPPELRRLALYKDPSSAHGPGVHRYSVAVWKVTAPESGEVTYWVGVELRWNALAEFFFSHFSDDVYNLNEWKKGIAPVCRGK